MEPRGECTSRSEQRVTMRAIILAAGKGARLAAAAGDGPKCLARVGGITLIERQIGALRCAAIRRIAIVVGHRADMVRSACGDDVEYVENPRYAVTNSLYSLWLARDLLLDGFIVLNADVFFHPQLLADLLRARHDDALLIDYCDPALPLGEEEMKVTVKAGRVTDISKTLDPRLADGENVGIVKFGAAGAVKLVDLMHQLIAAGCRGCWAPRAFREFAVRWPLHAIGTRGFPWIEIDSPEDYRRAIGEVLPRIQPEEVRPAQLAVVTGARSRV